MAQDYENYDEMLGRVRELAAEGETEGSAELNVAQAAEALGLDPEVVLTWCKRGDTFPHAHATGNGDYRIPFGDVEAMRRGGRLHDTQEPIAEE